MRLAFAFASRGSCVPGRQGRGLRSHEDRAGRRREALAGGFGRWAGSMCGRRGPGSGAAYVSQRTYDQQRSPHKRTHASSLEHRSSFRPPSDPRSRGENSFLNEFDTFEPLLSCRSPPVNRWRRCATRCSRFTCANRRTIGGRGSAPHLGQSVSLSYTLPV